MGFETSAKDLATNAVENECRFAEWRRNTGFISPHYNIINIRESVIATAIESVDGVVLKGVEFREALKKRQLNLKNTRALKTLNSSKKLPKTRQKVTKKPASKTKPKRL